MRIDLAVTVPGLIKGAFCHTLILENDELKIIKVSRGWRVNPKMNRKGQQQLVDSVIVGLKNKATAESQKLTDMNLASYMVKKGSLSIKKSDISDVSLAERPDGIIELLFVGLGKKYRFVLDGGTSAATADAFAASLK